MSPQEFQAYTSSMASDEITWRKPRTILIVIAWSITNASIILNVFLSGSQSLDWYFLLLFFFISVFAGMLLEDIKSIVLGIFEALFLTILLTYVGLILPALVGNGVNYSETQVIYASSIGYAFKMFFPLFPIMLIMGAIIGAFVEDWLF